MNDDELFAETGSRRPEHEITDEELVRLSGRGRITLSPGDTDNWKSQIREKFFAGIAREIDRIGGGDLEDYRRLNGQPPSGEECEVACSWYIKEMTDPERDGPVLIKIVCGGCERVAMQSYVLGRRLSEAEAKLNPTKNCWPPSQDFVEWRGRQMLAKARGDYDPTDYRPMT